MKFSIARYYRFLFGYIYKGYTDQGEKDIPGLYTLLFISTVFFTNILSLYILLIILFDISNELISGITGVFIFFVLVLMNYLYFYFYKKKDEAASLFQEEKHSSIKTWVLGYIVSSLITIIVLFIIYFNSP